MIGTGMTPEGINQNDINFDLMNELAWRNEEFDISDWMLSYVKRRYGEHPSEISGQFICSAFTIVLNIFNPVYSFIFS